MNFGKFKNYQSGKNNMGLGRALQRQAAKLNNHPGKAKKRPRPVPPPDPNQQSLFNPHK
jgi:hypothetical protein